jgi:hypothetical protein
MPGTKESAVKTTALKSTKIVETVETKGLRDGLRVNNVNIIQPMRLKLGAPSAR